MKKISVFIFLGVIILASAFHSYAAVGSLIQTKEAVLTQRENRIATREAKITQVQANISQDLRDRAEKEISRRLSYLNELIKQLSGIRKLSSAQKTDLQGQIQTQIDGLNALQVKINADTDNATLKTDVKSIIGNYYIFLFFRVKVNLLVASDRASATADNLSGIATKLQTRIDQAKTAGNDVANLTSQLSDMNAKITDAKTQIGAVQTELTPLTAQGYPGNKSILTDARTKVKTVITDLKNAYTDALQIRNGLKGLKIANPEASSSAH
jgi:predicted  nucleic acid-binding Zn-ribbon protein